MIKRQALTLAIGTVLAGGLSASPGLADHRGGSGGFGPSWFEELDANGDGSVTQAEVDDARRARLAEYDRNGDGQLSLEEYQELWLAAMRERMVDRFQALDDDGDAVVTVEEFVEPYSRMVRRLDTNGDGQITEDDRRQRRGREGPGRGRGEHD